MTRPIKLVAKCRWYWRDVSNHAWIASDESEPPYVGPACIGPTRKKISVWLPSGKRIVLRVSKWGADFPTKRHHYYGAGFPKENKIEIKLRELQPGEQWPAKPHADSFKL